MNMPSFILASLKEHFRQASLQRVFHLFVDWILKNIPIYRQPERVKPLFERVPWMVLTLNDAFGCGDEAEEASKVSGEFVVPCCDAPEVVDLAEAAFDQIAVLVDCGIEAAPFGGCRSARNGRFCSCRRDGDKGALAFTNILLREGIAISMDGRVAWCDNVVVERLWCPVKYGEVIRCQSLRRTIRPPLILSR
ncbi:hypothetical protein Sbs19_40860 [Sphingobium sp. BS19]|nr:hypothetical protein Sbs19_40860 [Sphingobium sp. BS19]